MIKGELWILGILSILCYGAWIGYHYLSALGKAYGNSNPAFGPGDTYPVFFVIALLTLTCIVAAFFVSHNLARVLTLAPIVFILLGQGFFTVAENKNRAQFSEGEQAKRLLREDIAGRLSRDYVLSESKLLKYSSVKESFISHDRELNTLVRIDVSFAAHLDARPIGLVNGDTLEVFSAEADFNREYYQQYLNQASRSIFDDFRLTFNPSQEYQVYQLEKYEQH